MWVIGFALIWIIYLRALPSIEELVKWEYFRESTVIYDKNGDEIYSIFKDGKRTYIPYDAISQSIKDAIVSTEDGTFFENPGIDINGLARAGINYIFWVTDRIKGTSTISQQLVRNTLISNEQTLARKIKEIYLSYKLNNAYTKEDILEMYLNAISFWSNANGVEQASRTFFGKSAKDVWPLGAAILASLPKWPSYYSPYTRRERLMGFVEIYPTDDTTERMKLLTDEEKNQYRDIYDDFRRYIQWLAFESFEEGVKICGVDNAYIKDSAYEADEGSCIELDYDELLDFVGHIVVRSTHQDTSGDIEYFVEYTIGRKDFVASQMLKEGKIDGATFWKILYDGLDFSFRKYTENIKYPYFVMYVKEYLESTYSKDLDISSGLKVYTTIDPILQEKAEEVLKKQVETNKKFYGASSAALISMDNKDGKLLAMVGWPDYFDIENGGNNNMTIALRQPGSSFKPFIYALAIAANPIGPESPVADIETAFWKWKPDNYDKTFKGVMSLQKALWYSRNIPAAKMFYLAWGEEAIVKIWKNLWLSTLKENAWYWAPMAIGTAEVRPIDLMQAYSVLANNGIRKDIYFIEKIEDSNGNIIEEHRKDTPSTEVLSPAASYIVTRILSSNDARPESTFWRNALSIAGRTIAAKTGTSNKDVTAGSGKPKSILPRDLWTAGYSPQITTVVWAGNVNGKETKGSCDGLNCAASIWKAYMEFAHKNLPKEEFVKPKNLFTYNIVKSSGLLARSDTPQELITSTIMAVKLDTYDGWTKELKIDMLCNWPATDLTPPEAVKTVYVPSVSPIVDGYDPSWTTGFYKAARMILSDDTSGTGTIWTYSEEPCVRPESPGNTVISLEISGNIWKKWIFQAAWTGERPIKKARVYQNKEIIKTEDFWSGSNINGTIEGDTGIQRSGDIIRVELIDSYGYSYSEERSVSDSMTPNSTWASGSTETSTQDAPPKITITNPRTKQLNIYQWDVFNLRFRADVSTSTREITTKIDNTIFQSATTGNIFVIPIGTQWLSVGTHNVSVMVVDGKFRSDEATFQLNILSR